MFFYLQTLGEFTGFSVTDRYILPCLDKILDVVGEGREISAIVIKCEYDNTKHVRVENNHSV